ncbi:helix-turn-helix domain-containing protein [Nakamurella alba]|uniref:helix-turn-helix domain-containing protein n=1 Tax=Nakamurella alba TaxID=2665158 RepID=UPI002AC360FE|nr:helix-turn-helix domain-containing protein [Nakamurella alba]
MATAADLAVLVREARTAAGWTQAELAQRCRVSREWVIRLEKGVRRIELGLVLDVLAVLGIKLNAEKDDRSDSDGLLDQVLRSHTSELAGKRDVT